MFCMFPDSKSEWKKWATSQRFIRKEITTYTIGTLIGNKIILIDILLNLWHHRVWQRNVGKETTSKLEIVVHSSYCHQLILVQDVLTKLSNYTFRKKNLKKFSRFRIQHWQKPKFFFLIRWKIFNRIEYENMIMTRYFDPDNLIQFIWSRYSEYSKLSPV